jgi:hypothetical protein
VIGCVSYHSGTPLKLQPVVPEPDRKAVLVVGVIEPEIKLDTQLFEGADPEAWTSTEELDRAIKLIRDMRATKLYYEVDFKSRLKCEPDIVLEVHKNPRLSDCDADAAMLLIYGGVVPAYTTCDQGHYFSWIDRPEKNFEFPWHETELFGWYGPILNLFPGWSWKPDNSRLPDTFRDFLLLHESELFENVEPKGAPTCRER